MKKTILGLAFLTIASFSFSAVAQNQTDKQAKSNTECVAKDKCKKDCKKGDRKGGKKGDFKKDQKRTKANPFEGITLTTEQQGRIEALNSAMKVSRQELRTQAKTARENRDTTFNPRAAQKQLRSKYINDLGEILTSDQMTVFLKNYYVNHGGNNGKKAIGNRQGKGQKFDKGNRPGKGDFKGNGNFKGKGQRMEKQGKRANADSASASV